MKVRKGKRSDHLVNEEDEEDQPASEPQVEDDEYNLQRGIQVSLESFQAPIDGVAIREPDSGIIRKLPEVEGKGKGIVSDEQVAQSLLDLQKPKKKSTTDQYIFQRRTPATQDASTGPSTQPQDDTSANVVHDTPSPVDAETGADTEKSNSEMNTEILYVEEEHGEEVSNMAGSNPEQSHVVQAGPNPEPMHEDFVATVYPQVHESLKLTTEEHVHIENPPSSSGTLSSMKNLDDAFTFGDQFLNDKPSEEEPGKANMETEVESMITVPIHQASSLVSLLSTPIIDLTPPKPISPPVQEPIITTTMLLPPPPPPQQRTTDLDLATCVSALEKICANFEKKNKLQDKTTQALSSRVYVRRSTRLTPPAPMPIVDKADEMILQDTLQIVEGPGNVIDDSLLPRNDERNILGTRIDPRSDKESPEVEITNDKEVEITNDKEVEITNDEEVEITNVVIPVNVTEVEEEITDEVYELKRREKGKIVKESWSTPFLTPIRSPRIHTDLELQERYGYLFEHLKTRFLSRKSFDTLADHLQEVMVESVPTMVDTHIKEQVKKQVPEQRGNIQAEISVQIQKAIDNHIPSQVDTSIRSYMSEHILHVHPAQSQTTSIPEQQYQLYLSMKDDPQLQQQDITIWLALQMKFERFQVPQTTCRTSAVRPRDQEDPHDDAHPEGENSAKRQKTSEYKAYVSGESSSGQVNKNEQGPSTLGNQEQEDDYDFWTESYASDDDEIPTKQMSQDIMERQLFLTTDKIAEENVPAPTRTDEQLVPLVPVKARLPIRKSNLLMDLQKMQKNPIFHISVDILQNTNFFKAFTASADVPSIYVQQFWNTLGKDDKTGVYNFQLNELWFNLNADVLCNALEITPKDTAHPFVPPPAGDLIIDFEPTVDYVELIWEEFMQAIKNFFSDMANIKILTKKPKHHVIPYCRFTKLIIYYLREYYKKYLEMAVRKPRQPTTVTDKEGGKKKAPEAGIIRKLPKVEGKGKGIVSDEQVAQSLLDLQKPKKKNAETGADTEKSNSEMNTEILYVEEEHGQAGSDPGKTPESRPLPERVLMEEDQAGSNPGQSHVVQAGPNPEPMHEDFVAIVYPQVHESLKLTTEEHVHIENPPSSSGTLSSMKNLDDAFTFGDQFLNDKTSEEEPGKANMETEVESMVTVPIHQASLSVSLLSTPIIDLTPPKPISPPVQEPIITTTTATTTTLPPPPPPPP
ncbi:hypothetical protein Tco_0450626 [Tanacetum coccineum]